ncbi:MAG TPA: alcohol dehydrogenase catalytic domain-containing protein [Pyrinomonadaceae bacterium]|nr:alcohol dehydrogenase catalytic domain-containing protein [Pyrinomonadaceae bacterium]
MSASTLENGQTIPTESNQTMRASVLCDVGRIEVRDVPRPVIAPHEVLVRVAAVGLCGTDAHIFAGHANYNTNEQGQSIPLALQPQILGHEISGVIEETGRSIKDLRVGDRVVIDQGINCVSRRREVLCEYCRTGDSHQCEFYREHGITGLPGGLADFIAVPAVNAVRMTAALAFSAAALVEPLGCIIHSSDKVTKATTRHQVNGGSKEGRVRALLICGAGPAGLLFTQYLRKVLRYDAALFVSDPNERKRELARQLGADEALDPSQGDLVEVVREHTGGKGVEYLIEASGAGEVLASIPGLICKQAAVLLYGHGHAGTDLSVLNNVMFKEPVLVASVGASGGFEQDGRPSVYTRALNLIEQGQIDVNPLITHEYNSFESVATALGSEMNHPDYVKGVVVI